MNTVMGIPEPEFRGLWIQRLWLAMAKTGKGFKRASVRHTGRLDVKTGERDCRKDKLASTKLMRRLAQKCQVA
jgi:hypothetical protein